MGQLIRHRRVEPDTWQLLEDPSAALPADGDVIVSLATWLAERDRADKRKGRTAVWLAGNDDPAALEPDLARLPLVAVKFASFGDGRGFSTARLLRERHGYGGEIRAIGQVIRDWLLFMERCGFDAFLLRDDEDPANALQAFGELADAYQASVVEPLPLFRRRLAAENR